MNDFHGIIFAYSTSPELDALVRTRTSSSLPFCGRYRLIDFALSSMSNAGIRDVGVIMKRDYQSLLDHLGSGKDWDLSRRFGGLRMLPPFGLPEYHTGAYTGTIEALNAVSTYIRDIPQSQIVLMNGNMAANIDLASAMKSHIDTGAELTAICSEKPVIGSKNSFIPSTDNYSQKIVIGKNDKGFSALEAYIISKKLLIRIMDSCAAEFRYHFHSDALTGYLLEGGRINLYLHSGYAATITTVSDYFTANMDMLCPEIRSSIFPYNRPVRTKNHQEVSTYYGEHASSQNSLISDGCIIEGNVKNCIISTGVHISEQAELSDCIIMRGGTIGEHAQLKCVIADKYTNMSSYITLTGRPNLPIVVPKGSAI